MRQRWIITRYSFAAWIPQASVTGLQPDSKCFGYAWDLATYNGNNHVGFDGEYKATGHLRLHLRRIALG